MSEQEKQRRLKLENKMYILKIVDLVIYISITIMLCLSLIFDWSMCRYITCIIFCLTIISDLVVENLIYKEYLYSKIEDGLNEK